MDLLEPVCVPLVEVCAQPLRRRAVDRLLHEDVAEAEAVAVRGRTKPRSDEHAKVCSGRRRGVGLEERDDVIGRELLPITAARSSTARSPGPSRSRRVASSACTVGGRARSVRPPSSASATSCSRKNGFPSAASTMRLRWSDSRISPPSPARSASVSSVERASSSMRSASSRPSRKAGRSSRSSSRARQTRRIGPFPRPATCSIDVEEGLGSAQWMSSKRRRAAGRARAPRRAGGRSTRRRPPEEACSPRAPSRRASR